MDHHDRKQCIRLFKKLSEYIDDELDRSLCEKIETHLKSCPPCQACLSTLKQTVAMCRELKAEQVPADFSDRLRKMLLQQARQL
jgi:anti-sigma factor RsiW